MSEREQVLINVMFEIVVSRVPGGTREERATWLAGQLRELGFNTKPMGSSWGVLVDDRRS